MMYMNRLVLSYQLQLRLKLFHPIYMILMSNMYLKFLYAFRLESSLLTCKLDLVKDGKLSKNVYEMCPCLLLFLSLKERFLTK